MTDLPMVSAAMPCRNERRHIEQSVRSVLASDYPPHRLSLLVLDGMSDDGTRQILDELAEQDGRVRIVDNPDLLPAPAMNLAIEAARGEVFLRMDAHTIYPPDYVRRCVEVLLETDAGNVGGLWETSPGADTPTAAAIAYALGHRFGVGSALYRTGVPDRREVDTVPFGCWRLTTLKRLGGFATDLPYAEDDELNARLRARGGRIVLDPTIRSRYIARPTLRTLALQMFRYGRFKPCTSARIGRLVSWRQIVPPAFVAVLGLSVLVGTIFPPALLLAVAALLAHLAVGSLVGFGAPAPLPALAKVQVPLVLLTMHIAYGLGYLLGMFAVARGGTSAG